MPTMSPGTTIIFDFTTKTIIAAGASADADQRLQEFIARQATAAQPSAR